MASQWELRETACSNLLRTLSENIRVLGAKPPKEAQPRLVVVSFQEFKTKVLVLHSAWGGTDRRIYFDHVWQKCYRK